MKKTAHVEGQLPPGIEDTLKAEGIEVVPGKSVVCPVCGFLGMTDAATGEMIMSLCVCELRKVHASTCKLLKAAECKVDTGCDCEEDTVDCPTCYPCTCKGEP